MQAAPLGRGSERPGLAAPHPRCPLLPPGAVQPRPPPPPTGGPRRLPVPVLTSRAQWTAGEPGGSQGGRGSSKHVERGPQGRGDTGTAAPTAACTPCPGLPTARPARGGGFPTQQGTSPPPSHPLPAPSPGHSRRSRQRPAPAPLHEALGPRHPSSPACLILTLLPSPQPHHPRGGALKDGAGSRPSLCPSVRPNGPREPMAGARTAQSPGGPTCTAITDRTSTEIRLNSSKQPQAPVWARPL